MSVAEVCLKIRQSFRDVRAILHFIILLKN